MPILILCTVLNACTNSDKSVNSTLTETEEQLHKINRNTIEHQEKLIDEMRIFYSSLYILPINSLMDHYQHIDSMIMDSRFALESLQPAETDSMFWKCSTSLFAYYDSAWDSHFWEMLLIMEQFELEGVDRTHLIAPLMDSVLEREQQLLLNLENAQNQIQKEYNLTITE